MNIIMKKSIYSLLIILVFIGKVNAQNTTSEIEQITERLKSETEKLDLDIKAKNQEVAALKKEAMAKKLQAIKDKPASATLKTEALDLDQKAKIKLEEIATMRKQLADNKKQLTELAKQNKPKTQVSVNPNIAKTITSPINKAQIPLGEFVEIFELPNYHGKSVVYRINTQNNHITIPFTSNNISIKFSNENRIILLFAMESTKAVRTFLNSYTNLNINIADITSIIVGTKKKLEVSFNGIIYDINHQTYVRGIHNDDCKKIYGDLAYKLEIKMRINTGFATTTLFPIGQPVDRNADGKIEIFNLPKYKDYAYPFVYNSENAYLTLRTRRQRESTNTPPSYEQVLFTTPDLPNARKYFYIDSASYLPNKNTYSFTAYVKIGSAHKYCPACTDFTWDAEMKTSDEVKLELPYDIQEGYIDNTRQQWYRLDFLQVGPFRKENYLGQPTKKDNFIGPPHPTYIQFTTKRMNP
ncbi:MAG: hypothetical protein EOP00_08460 [Pedobacter sp.]|nr:MAG: hypothetical protein EOP00_08460 [Pedobacter sp.]